MAEIQPTVVIDVVGCHYREEACKAMMADTHWMEKITLQTDPDNEYDPQAIKVMYLDRHVGYVSKKTYDDVREYVEKGVKVTECTITDAKFMDVAGTKILKWFEVEISY